MEMCDELFSLALRWGGFPTEPQEHPHCVLSCTLSLPPSVPRLLGPPLSASWMGVMSQTGLYQLDPLAKVPYPHRHSSVKAGCDAAGIDLPRRSSLCPEISQSCLTSEEFLSLWDRLLCPLKEFPAFNLKDIRELEGQG